MADLQVKVTVVMSCLFGLLGGLNWQGGIAVLANASMALALSAHPPRVQFSVYHMHVSAGWRSELG